jgi:Nif-specific ferredoxin III
MATTGLTRGGDAWVPRFVEALDHATCIGCGRCYKVCPRDVFDLVDREQLGDDEDLDDDDGFDDDNAMVMVIANKNDCIGCQACAKVCPKDCHAHVAA